MKSWLPKRLVSFFHKDLNANEADNVNTFTCSPLIKQIWVAFAPLILTVNLGMISGYSAVLLPQLLQSGNEITQSEASWIASMAALPMALGSLLGGFLLEKCGRKSTHIIVSPVLSAGWVLIYMATNTKFILCGRFVTGFCCGILGSATGVYIGETSAPKYRGILLGGIAFAVSLGLMAVHLLGTFLHWTTTALISSILPMLALILLLFMPESPSWLAKKGKTAKAEASFRWCRGDSDEASKELAVMLQRQADSPQARSNNFREIFRADFLKPLGIVVVYIVANQWAGVNAITFYTVTIMRDTVGEGLNEYLAMLIVDLIRVLMSTLACVLLRKFGRRPLALVSGVGTFLSLFVLSSYIKLSKLYPTLSQESSVPMIALVSYISFISIGFVPLPWALIGELFPLKQRSLGSGISSFMAFAAFFSVVKTSPGMFEGLGASGTFLVYGIVAFLGTIFIYFVLPETKGKLLYQIEDHFRRAEKVTGSIEKS